MSSEDVNAVHTLTACYAQHDYQNVGRPALAAFDISWPPDGFHRTTLYEDQDAGGTREDSSERDDSEKQPSSPDKSSLNHTNDEAGDRDLS